MAFFRKDEQLETLGDRVLETTWAEFPGLARNQIALTWVVYDPPVSVNTGGALSPDAFWNHAVRGFSYRGVERIYPASVVKLFYLVAMHEWLEKGMIQPSAELERAARDMIVDSSNDATSLVVDVLTGTTSGPELPLGPFETWKQQRNLVNRYFQSLGWPELETINLNQKTWCDGAYGRERAFLGELMENRNMLTTEASARLVHSIVGGVAVSSERSQAMMALMKRSLDPNDLAADPENQVTGFLGGGLPQAAQVWSKAGLTSQVRHDAAYVELAGKRPYLLVVFTEGKAHSQNEAILPFVSQQVAAAIASIAADSA
ncbi:MULTISPECIES: serine hydrolase [Trichocoleus]|uniref:Class A beta-lactamase-related serine hydrolase n=1 Tax=Trichocoleus desertorum GB2-A4 TaxID=2933944 RepID=A0ABV0J794_9CYAN|nr:serine hydrolase [Trichocoleus sp. FACHB-46]MBD1863742.1 serine hydrolase [Trichocoleus sp. FACHB-46]